MFYTTLICADTVKQHLYDANWITIDCRFSLIDSEAGAKSYRMGHIPNAHYAHIEQDLSSPVSLNTGRHPLPNFKQLIARLGEWGINNKSQIVIYDDVNGAFAARLWWLLRYLGHDTVAILDGGIQQWQQKYTLTTSLPKTKKSVFRAYSSHSSWLTTQQVSDQLARNKIKLIDARTPERFSGQQEPIDPIAGHIPKAVNRAFHLNLSPNGLFLDRATLHTQFNHLLGSAKPENSVHMCGSGITACHNILAMEHAGLSGSKLYAGSWSEWITNRNRSISTK